MGKATVSAKVNFMLYLIKWNGYGLSYKVVSSLLRVIYQSTKFCFSLHFSFNDSGESQFTHDICIAWNFRDSSQQLIFHSPLEIPGN